MENEKELRKKVIALLENIYDPEIPVNIYRLGLIYKIEFIQNSTKTICFIKMTLTSAACPVAESLIDQVNNIAYFIEEIDEMIVEVVFDPPWTQDKMSYEAKLELGLL